MKPSKQDIDIAHEMGHLMLGKLFEDVFTIESLTLDPTIHSSSITITKETALVHLKVKKKYLQAAPLIVRDKIRITHLGGCVAQNIFLDGQKTFKLNMDRYLEKPELLNREGCSKDFEKAKQIMDRDIFDGDRTEHGSNNNFLRFAFEYLSSDKVWLTIQSFFPLIKSRSNLTIYNNEIHDQFKRVGFLKFLYWNKISILKKRYKVRFFHKVQHYLYLQ